MQNNLELPVVLHLHRSRWCTIWATAVHAGACILPWFSSLAWSGKFLLLIPLVISYRSVLRKHCLLSHPQSVIRIMLNDAGEWWLTMADGACRQMNLLTPCFVHARLVVLGFTALDGSRRIHVMITPDRTGTDDLRRLRVRLRLPRESWGNRVLSGSDLSD